MILQQFASFILTKLNLIPRPLVEVAEPVVRARTIIAATKLGVFDQLAREPMACAQLARTLGVDSRSLQFILDSLVGFGYLRNRNGQYADSPMARKFLVRNSPMYVGNMVLYQDIADVMTQSFATIVRTGRPVLNYEEYLSSNPERWESYVLGMMDTARLSTQEVAAKVLVPRDATTLLDLGGAHGIHAMSLCRRHPNLRAVVFDRAECVAVGRRVAEHDGMSDRVTYQAGDFWRDAIGENWDVVLLFAILHLCSPERNQALLCKVYEAMSPGGVLVIGDFLADRLPRAWSAQFSLGMIGYFGEAQTYDRSSICRWLTNAGFTGIEVRHLRNPASLVQGRKPQ